MWFQLNWVVFTSSHLNSWAFCWRSVFFFDSYIPSLPLNPSPTSNQIQALHILLQAHVTLSHKHWIYIYALQHIRKCLRWRARDLYMLRFQCHCILKTVTVTLTSNFPNGRRIIGSEWAFRQAERHWGTELRQAGSSSLCLCKLSNESPPVTCRQPDQSNHFAQTTFD